MKRKDLKPWDVHIFRDGREMVGESLYNLRKMDMRERQLLKCAICYYTLYPDDVTFDHQNGRGMGGAKVDDRIVLPDGTWVNAAVHLICNTVKASKRYEWKDGVYIPCKSHS